MLLPKNLVMLAALLACQPALSDVLYGRVVGVSDGDTVTVLDSGRRQHRVRLTGIDAPEKAQQYGRRSKQSLSRMVYGKQVSVDWKKKDDYGRILGRVNGPDGDANLAQIQAGMAWHYKRYAKDQPASEREAYSMAENAAQRAGKGLWSDGKPTPPWDWRRAH